uniref:Small ribosomal subunit protein eS21 n=1 Tax=Oncorhynchus tshawytscha TaxID=74940 RepID=A0A8C8FLC3_ONCTS
ATPVAEGSTSGNDVLSFLSAICDKRSSDRSSSPKKKTECRTTLVNSWTCTSHVNARVPVSLILYATCYDPVSFSSASNRIIGAKDHASIQINIAEVDKATGRFNGQFKTYAICGAIRRMGEADDSLLRLAKTDSIVSKNF